MCGIYGSVRLPPDPQRIDIVAHRGPDGRGWQTFETPTGPVCLGHRRLAIIGLGQEGLQPMTAPGGRLHIVFNGEIYNYLELRADLMAKGESFMGGTDTEVLLRALAVWGLDATLPRLRGMFAFLLWDENKQQLYAVRDRYGIKPLYWAETQGGGIAFGSEIKQLVGLPGLGPRMNLARVHDYLAWGITDHGTDTLFAGIRQLRGGEWLTVDVGGGQASAVTLRRWHALPDPDDRLHISEDEAAERFRALLTDSVRVHLRADVPVGSCLSGGLDSSSIVCLMAGMLGEGAKVHTISACFEEKSVDERPFMEAVVAHAQTEPHFVYPRAEELYALAGRITWHQDEPFGSTSILAQWSVFDAAGRAGIKVMLDGQGADEQLAGYHSGYAWHLAGLVRRGRAGEALRIMRERAALVGVPLSAQLARLAAVLLPPGLAKTLRGRRMAALHPWLGTEAFRPFAGALSPQDAAVEELGLPPVRDIGSWCLAMTHASNLPMLLHWEDRNSMAHSVEARVPFVDHPLVDFTLALHSEHKFAAAETKRVLRRAMAGVLPRKVAERRDKLGFATPEAEWVRGPLGALAREGVEATLGRWPGLLDGPSARAMVEAMVAGRRAVDPSLWRIINLGIWGETFAVQA